MQWAFGFEHPQPLVDEIQYHRSTRNEHLPAASYRLATTVLQRGVFSFCMCPGGFIVPAATAGDEVVVNGMSLSRRDSPFANSGMVVSVEADDVAPFSSHGDLAGVAFQKSLEVMASAAGGGMQPPQHNALPTFLPRSSRQHSPSAATSRASPPPHSIACSPNLFRRGFSKD